MKSILLFVAVACCNASLWAQYPEPEFSDEVCYLKKGDTPSLIRLDKESSKMDTKVKAAGFGGAENGYTIEGDKSSIRLNGGKGLSFVYTTTPPSAQSSAAMDSAMRANGVDPALVEQFNNRSDPAKAIILYKVDVVKGSRKIYLMKSPGMFGGKKNSSSDKYTFSARKIKEGYWELIIDKTLPAGEYAFSVPGGMGSMDGSTVLYMFAIE
jgi:hypothetical protein